MTTQYLIQDRLRPLAAVTTKTLLQIVAPATRRLAVVEFGVSFQGITQTDPPVTIDLVRQTTAGTMTAQTPVLWDPASTAAQSSGQINATIEPTTTDILGSWLVTPTGGLFVVGYLPEDEPRVALSGRLAVRAVSAALGASVNVTSYIRWREIG